MIDGEHQKVTIAKVSDSMIFGYSRKVSSIEFSIANIDNVRERNPPSVRPSPYRLSLQAVLLRYF